MSDAPERCPYQIGPHDSMGCAACEDGLRAENARLREALAKAVIALEEIAGSLSDEGRLAESALKRIEEAGNE